MSVNRIEALLDSIAALKGASTNPDSELYQIRNPIGVLSFSRPGKTEINEKGQRVFGSWLAGYRAAAYDIDLKVRGLSRAGIKREDQLQNVLRVYGVDSKLAMSQVCKFLRRALKNQDISPETPLTYFYEETK